MVQGVTLILECIHFQIGPTERFYRFITPLEMIHFKGHNPLGAKCVGVCGDPMFGDSSEEESAADENGLAVMMWIQIRMKKKTLYLRSCQVYSTSLIRSMVGGELLSRRVMLQQLEIAV